jgi:hypothetical protein
MVRWRAMSGLHSWLSARLRRCCSHGSRQLYRPPRLMWILGLFPVSCFLWPVACRLWPAVPLVDSIEAVHVSGKLDASRMLVTEKVFGFLQAALGMQLVLNGLSDVGVIHLTTGH